VLRVEVILGVIASSIAIIAFMARAYANIRRGNRIKRLGTTATRSADTELERLREEIAAADEISRREHRDSEPE
jgi:hypothetical protein